MSTAVAQFLRIYTTAGATVKQWQSYWLDRTVDGHAPMPFTLANIISAAAAGAQSASVTLPFTPETLSVMETALASGHLVTLQLYQFDPPVDGSLPGSKTLMAEFHGEAVAGSADASSATIEVGSSLDPIGAQAPPRKFTTALIGTPPMF